MSETQMRTVEESTAQSPRASARYLVQRSTELRDEWARDPGNDVSAPARELLKVIVGAGAIVADQRERDLLAAELAWWKRWFVTVIGEFVTSGPLMQFVASEQEQYSEMSLHSFLAALEMRNSVHGGLIRGEDFSSNELKPRLLNAFAAGKIVNCRFEDCDFRTAEFGDAKPRAGLGPNFIYTAFVDCKWDRVRWSGARASSLAFENAPDIDNADFNGANFADVLFKEFGGTSMRFSRASFTESKFVRLTFDEGEFRDAAFTWCQLKDVTFHACDLAGTAFHGCDLRGTTFAGGSLENVLFSECNMAGVQLESGPGYDRPRENRTDLRGVDLESSFDIPTFFRELVKAAN